MTTKANFRSNSGAIGRICGLAAFSLSTIVMSSLSIQPVFAELSSQDNNPRIAPIQSHPSGKTYGQWAATWWQWALQTPASVNPLLDKGDCRVGQKGHVWFIGGTFSGEVGKKVERNCTVPTGTALFFPLFNAFYGAVEGDPDKTETYLRSQVAYVNKDNLTLLEAKIDGVQVKNPTQYLEKSPLFDVQLPKDNIYGVDNTQVPQLLLSPSVDQGYYLFLNPLTPGTHTIEWKAKISTPNGNQEQNVKYIITVRPGYYR